MATARYRHVEESPDRSADVFVPWAFNRAAAGVYDDATGLQNIVLDLANRHDPNDKTFLGVTIPGQNATDDFAEELAYGRIWFEVVGVEERQRLVSRIAQVLRTEVLRDARGCRRYQ